MVMLKAELEGNVFKLNEKQERQRRNKVTANVELSSSYRGFRAARDHSSGPGSPPMT